MRLGCSYTLRCGRGEHVCCTRSTGPTARSSVQASAGALSLRVPRPFLRSHRCTVPVPEWSAVPVPAMKHSWPRLCGLDEKGRLP
jgi:hypothetical protein